jgi:hypothetical protein
MRAPTLLIAASAAAVSCVAKPSILRESSAPAQETELHLPRQGEVVLDARVYYGIPILQKSFYWDGNGEVDAAGIKLRELWHASDSFAIGSGVTASNWFLGGDDAQAVEFEAVGRMIVHRAADESSAWFFELTGGYQYATDPVPDGGTVWNWTFSFGPGVLVPISEHFDFEGGVTYHHVSNALGRDNDRNPSQNEAQVWMGFALRF